jgi:hypothetical protein
MGFYSIARGREAGPLDAPDKPPWQRASLIDAPEMTPPAGVSSSAEKVGNRAANFNQISRRRRREQPHR